MKISVLSFNVFHFGNFKKRHELDTYIPEFADYIKKINADIVGFNEVYDDGPNSGFKNQVANVAKMSDYKYDFFAKATDVDEDDIMYPFGNGLMSHFPFESGVIPIPDPPKSMLNGEYAETRCVLRADFNFNDKRLTVLDCHFGLNDAEQENAVKIICDIADSCDNDIILMGDFNATPDCPILQPLYDRFTDTSELLKNQPFTFPSDNPFKKIDYILTKGNIKICSATVIEEIISDHLPVLVVLDLDY